MIVNMFLNRTSNVEIKKPQQSGCSFITPPDWQRTTLCDEIILYLKPTSVVWQEIHKQLPIHTFPHDYSSFVMTGVTGWLTIVFPHWKLMLLWTLVPLLPGHFSVLLKSITLLSVAFFKDRSPENRSGWVRNTCLFKHANAKRSHINV